MLVPVFSLVLEAMAVAHGIMQSILPYSKIIVAYVS